MRSFQAIAGTALAAASLVSAQTYSSCDPMNATCTPDTGLDMWTITTNFTQGASEFKKNWTAEAGTYPSYDSSKGLIFNITKEGEAPTVETDYYIFFGKVEVKMQASPGTGIVSSIVLLSDDLDEIDWEWLGGNNTSVETNYFGKGNTTLYDRAIYYDVETPTTEMHTYTVDWTEESIIWSIDGTNVRTLEYADADSGYDFPQTPLRIKLGSWCGGCSSSYWTREWAGGNATFDGTSYLMYVESVTVTNYNPALSYNWTDTSGSYESIKASNDTSIDSNLESTSSSSSTTSGSGVVTSTSVITTTNSAGQTVTSTSVITSTSSSDSFSQSSSASSTGAASGRAMGSAAAILAVSFVGLAFGAFLI